MKLFFFTTLFFIYFIGFSQSNSEKSNSINWIENFDEAKLISSEQDKPLLIFFTGSDWCKPCKNLVADFFNSKKFKEIASDELILYKADFPKNKSLVTAAQKKDNIKIKNKFGINSYPTIYVLNSSGKFMNKMEGYYSVRDTQYHFLFINSILSKTNKKSTK